MGVVLHAQGLRRSYGLRRRGPCWHTVVVPCAGVAAAALVRLLVAGMGGGLGWSALAARRSARAAGKCSRRAAARQPLRRGGQVPLDLLMGPVAVAYSSEPLLRWLLQWPVLGTGINAATDPDAAERRSPRRAGARGADVEP